jgi:ketosteroid isomerase-like protein
MNTSEQTLAVIADVFAAFHAHDLVRFRALLAEDVVMPDATGIGPALSGPDAVVAAVSVVGDAFPDLRVTVTNAFADGERGVAEVLREGTHAGPLRLPGGPISPTGRALRLPECVVFRVRGGRVSSMTAYTDPLSGMTQLGLLPSG